MAALNRDDVIAMLGPVDDFVIAEIIGMGATASELCRRLGFANGYGKTALKRRSVRLAKLVHDLNASLHGVPGLQPGRLVRFRKKQRRYALTGARATVVHGAPR